MKAVFIGCVETSLRALQTLLSCDGIEICGVVTRRASPFNADFCALEPIASAQGIPVFFADGQDHSVLAEWIDAHKPDVCFCVGWSFLLPKRILDIPSHGVVGYHPAALPRNRGRHPIIWALALGLDETASTFFIMDEHADSGDIIAQQRVLINYDDDAASLYARLLDVAEIQLRQIAADFVGHTLQRVPQDHACATYWRKRNKDDGQIDWRMPAEGIRNLVRALAKPYVGAHCLFADREVKIHKVETVPGPVDVETGRVLCVDGTSITVKAGTDAVRLIDHAFDPMPAEGDCLR